MAKEKLRHVYEIYILTTPERLWKALTKFELTQKYYYSYGLKTELKRGALLEYMNIKTGRPRIVGKVLEVVPKKRLVHTFQFQLNKRLEAPSRVTYEIEKQGKLVKLTLIHDRFFGRTYTWRVVQSGWRPILDGLKTWLETGRSLFE